MSESNPYRTVVLVGVVFGPVAALLALIALVVAITGGGGTPGPSGSMAQFDLEIEALNKQAQDLRQDLDELQKAVTELGAGGGLDEEAVRAVVTRQVRDIHVRAGGKLRIPVTELPEPVVDACLKLLPGAELTTVEQRSEDGRIYYRIDCRLGDSEAELRVWEDGTVSEADLPPEAAPEAVLAAARKMFPGIEVDRLELQTDDDVRVWEIEGEMDGKECGLRATADGNVLEAGMDPALAPKAVLQAAKKAVGGLRPHEVWMEREDDGLYYWVGGRRGRDKYGVTTLPDGTLVEIEMPLNRVPGKIRSAAMKAVPKIKLSREAVQAVEDGEKFYVLRGKARGKEYEIIVGLDGTIIEIEGPEGGDEDDAPPAPAPRRRPAGPDGDVEAF